MSRISCVQSSLCQDYPAFKVVYDQSDFRALEVAYVQKEYRAFKVVYVQTIVSSKIDILCGFEQNRSFKDLCPNFCAATIAYVQNFVRSKPDFVGSKSYNCHKN